MPGPAIRSVEAFVVDTPRKPLVFAAVETADGLCGVGEAAPNYAADGVASAIESIGEAVRGVDPARTNHVRAVARHPTVGTANNAVEAAAASAVDIACWDLRGQRAGAPVCALLGGSIHGDALPAYANGWWQPLREDDEWTPEAVGRAAESVVADGYDALKVNPFGAGAPHPDQAELNAFARTVGTVRERVGPDVDLYLEGHKRFTPSAALEVSRRLSTFEPGFFEEPTPPRVGQIGEVAAAAPVPVATGESLVSADAFGDYFAETALGIAQPDPVRIGGITEAREVVAAAATHGVGVALHNACGSLATAAAAHLAATAPTFHTQEVFEDYAWPAWASALYDSPVEIEDGTVAVPDGDGLGVSLDLDAVRERAR